MSIRLSVLIPTLPEAYSIRMLARLNAILDPQISQYSDKVEKIIHDAGRSMSTGQKRNELIAQASGDYIVQIDSDDVVSRDYVQELLKAIEFGPDVVTFCGHITENGGPKKKFVIKLGEAYEERGGVYYRFPNHLTAMRREAVKHVKFPNIYIQEDFQWASSIRNQRLLKTEIHLPNDLYLYEFVHPKPRA